LVPEIIGMSWELLGQSGGDGLGRVEDLLEMIVSNQQLLPQ
jgi:hypothetical protein